MDREFVGRGSWIVGRGSPCWFRRVDGVIWCWVAGVGFDNEVAVLYGAGLQVLGSAMEWLCSVVLGCGWLLRMA